MQQCIVRTIGVLTLVAASSMAYGEVILINLGGTDATPEVGDGAFPDYWNQAVLNGTLSTVVDDSETTLTGVTVSTSNLLVPGDNNTNNSNYASLSGATVPSWLDLDAVDQTWYGNGSGQIVITGLTGSAYQVDLISARSQSAGSADITIAGDFSAGDASDGWEAYNDGWRDAGVLTWTSVTPVAGSNSIMIEDGTSGLIYFTAIRLTAVPEPASLALLVVGGCLSLPSRRRLLR